MQDRIQRTGRPSAGQADEPEPVGPRDHADGVRHYATGDPTLTGVRPDRNGNPGNPADVSGTPRASASPGGGLGADIRDLEVLADWLDSRFRIPGTRIRFGLDSVLGLLPGIGDAATTLPAAYMLLRAHRMGVPTHVLGRMGLNVAVDLVVGSIPLVGDLFDLGFKANRRNVELLRRHFDLPARDASRRPV